MGRLCINLSHYVLEICLRLKYELFRNDFFYKSPLLLNALEPLAEPSGVLEQNSTLFDACFLFGYRAFKVLNVIKNLKLPCPEINLSLVLQLHG